MDPSPPTEAVGLSRITSISFVSGHATARSEIVKVTDSELPAETQDTGLVTVDSRSGACTERKGRNAILGSSMGIYLRRSITDEFLARMVERDCGQRLRPRCLTPFLAFASCLWDQGFVFLVQL